MMVFPLVFQLSCLVSTPVPASDCAAQERVCKQLGVPVAAEPAALATALSAAVREYRLRGNESISQPMAEALRDAILRGVSPNYLGRKYSAEAPLDVELRPALSTDGPVFERYGTFDEQLHIMLQLSRRSLGADKDPDEARRYALAAYAFAALFDDVELQTFLATAMKSDKVARAAQLSDDDVRELRQIPRSLLAARGQLVVNKRVMGPWYKLYAGLAGGKPWERGGLGPVLRLLDEAWKDPRITVWAERDICAKLRGLLVPLAARGEAESVREVLAKRDELARAETNPLRKRLLEMVSEGVKLDGAEVTPSAGK